MSSACGGRLSLFFGFEESSLVVRSPNTNETNEKSESVQRFRLNQRFRTLHLLKKLFRDSRPFSIHSGSAVTHWAESEHSFRLLRLQTNRCLATKFSEFAVRSEPTLNCSTCCLRYTLSHSRTGWSGNKSRFKMPNG